MSDACFFGKKPHFLQNKGSAAIFFLTYCLFHDNRPRAISSVKIGVIPPGEAEMVASAKGSLTQKLDNVLCDERQLSKVRFPLLTFWTICLLCALTSGTDAASIADYWMASRSWPCFECMREWFGCVSNGVNDANHPKRGLRRRQTSGFRTPRQPFNIFGIAVSRDQHAVDMLHFRNNTGNPDDCSKSASVNGLKCFLLTSP